MAERRWRTAGARSKEEFSSSCLNTVRRRFGIAAVRAFARHRLNRLRWVGVSRREIEKVIAEANAAQAQAQARRATRGAAQPMLPIERTVVNDYLRGRHQAHRHMLADILACDG